MATRLSIAALSALVALIAVTLQGCGSSVASIAGRGSAKAIKYYCSTDAGKIMKLLEVEKSRKVNAMCQKFKTVMAEKAEHSVDTEGSEHTIGIDAKLEIYCYGQAAEVWEKETLAAIEAEEAECVNTLTEKVKDISAAHVGEWTQKFNALVTESYDLMHGARTGVITKFEEKLDAALDAVDQTAEGVTKITDAVLGTMEHVVEDVCHWVNDDYLGKMEIAFNNSIARACDATKQFAGKINKDVNGEVEHDTEKGGGSIGIDLSIAIKYEQDCVEHNAGDAEKVLAEQTEKLTKECKDYVTSHLDGKTAKIGDLTSMAHDFIEGQRPECAKIENDFNVHVTTLLQMQAEFEANVDAGKTTRLFALPHTLLGSAAGTGASTVVAVCAGLAMVAAFLAVAIRARSRSPQEDTRATSMVLTGYDQDQDLLEGGAEEQ
mmetsp:Transcript_6447/g.13242  ORF Transcript_6447/g.13242 Transcript_6447/m.13242 type:complete len:434 (+) Transcript_6447:79-1380(+)